MGGGASKGWARKNGNGLAENKKLNKVPVAIARKAAIEIQRMVRGFLVRRRMRMILGRTEESSSPPSHQRMQMQGAKGGKMVNSSSKMSVGSSRIGGYQDFSSSVDVLYKYCRFTDGSVIIHPSVGFVVKTKAEGTGRKIFFNIMHHEAVPTMAQTPTRVLDRAQDLEETRAAAAATPLRMPRRAVASPLEASLEEEADKNSPLMPFIVDVVLPSKEYLALFKYNAADDRFDPIHESVKSDLAMQAIRFWNSQLDNYDISSDFTLPKIRRGYFGKLQALIMDTTTKYLSYMPPPATTADLYATPAAKQQILQRQQESRGNDFQLDMPPAFSGWCHVPTFCVHSLPTDEHEEARRVVKLEMNSSVLGNGQSVRMLMRSSKLNFDQTLRRQKEKEVSYFLPKPYQRRLPLYGPAYASALAAQNMRSLSGSGKNTLTAGLPAAVPRTGSPARTNTSAPTVTQSVRPVPPPLSAKPSPAAGGGSFSPIGAPVGGRKLLDTSGNSSSSMPTTPAGAGGAVVAPLVSPGARARAALGGSALPAAIMEGSEDELSSHHRVSAHRSVDDAAEEEEDDEGPAPIAQLRAVEPPKSKPKEGKLS